MRVDLYTKAVLTVIALCLVWLAIGASGVVPSVQAQDRNATRVVIVGAENFNSTSSRLPVVLSGWRDQYGAVHGFKQPPGVGGDVPSPLPVIGLP